MFQCTRQFLAALGACSRPQRGASLSPRAGAGCQQQRWSRDLARGSSPSSPPRASEARVGTQSFLCLAEEDGPPIQEGTGWPGLGKHIAKGWVWWSPSLTPPHVAAESSRAPGCSLCRPAPPACLLPLLAGTSGVPSSHGQRSMGQGPGSSTALPEGGSQSRPLSCLSFPTRVLRSPR